MKIEQWWFTLLVMLYIGEVRLELCSYIDLEGDMFCKQKNITALYKDEYPLNVTLIRKLNLASAYINTVTYNAFENLKNLTDLDMSDNSIKNLDYRLFTNTKFLKKLYLSRNQINSVDNRLFTSLVNLIELDISYNPISSFDDPQLLSSQIRLIYLNANSIGLKSVPTQVIAPLTSLQKLDLSENNIHCACHLKNITKWAETRCLKFSMNCINRGGYRSDSISAYRSEYCRKRGSVTTRRPYIDFYDPYYSREDRYDDRYRPWVNRRPTHDRPRDWPNRWDDFDDDRYFRRRHRPIYPIPKDYEYYDEDNSTMEEPEKFTCPKRKCEFLLEVSLMDCENIPLRTFKAGKYPFTERDFSELRLDSNEISQLESDAFNDITSLTSLSLRNNRLQKLDSKPFQKLKNLRFLDLSYNSLGSIFEEKLFSSQKQLRILYLNNNRLAFVENGLFRPTKYLKRLFMNSNPFNCDCNLQPTVFLVVKRKVLTNVICQEPPLYRGKTWYELETASYCRLATTHITRKNDTKVTLAFIGFLILLVALVQGIFWLCDLIHKYFPGDPVYLPDDFELF